MLTSMVKYVQWILWIHLYRHRKASVRYRLPSFANFLCSKISISEFRTSYFKNFPVSAHTSVFPMTQDYKFRKCIFIFYPHPVTNSVMLFDCMYREFLYRFSSLDSYDTKSKTFDESFSYFLDKTIQTKQSIKSKLCF